MQEKYKDQAKLEPNKEFLLEVRYYNVLQFFSTMLAVLLEQSKT